MGDRIAVFHQGRVEQLGAPLDLYNQPANEFVAAFLGTPKINLVGRPGNDAPGPARQLWDSLMAVRAPALTAGAGSHPVHRAGLRAEHLGVAAAGQGVPATVVLAEHLGDASVLHLRVEGLPELLNAKVGAGLQHMAAGHAVGLVPDAHATLAFDGQGRLMSA